MQGNSWVRLNKQDRKAEEQTQAFLRQCVKEGKLASEELAVLLMFSPKRKRRGGGPRV